MKLRELASAPFRSLALFALRHPGRVLAIAALVTLSAAPGILRLKLRTDGHALVMANAPEVVRDREIREQFGLTDNLVVLVRSRHPDGVCNSNTLQLIRDLTAEFAQLPGVGRSNVMSLDTEPGFRSAVGTLPLPTLLEPPQRTPGEIDQLRRDLRRIELYKGTLVSTDGRSTVILIGVPAGADRTRLYEAVQERIAARQPQMAKGGNDDVAVTGAPVAEALLGLHILEDLGVPRSLLGVSTQTREQAGRGMPGNLHKLRLAARRIGLVPGAALVMLVIFLISFRNLLAALVPLPGVATTLLFIFGVMGWLGVPVYLTLAVMPVLLTALGVTNDIYIFNRYFTLLREHPERPAAELLRETFDKMAGPVAGTSLTTAIGFLSFGFSPLGPVRAFGLCTGSGVLFGLFYSFTAVPALLAWLKPAWLLSGRGLKPTAPSALAAWFGHTGSWVVRRRWWVAGAVLLVAAFTPLGLRRLVVQDSWIDGFDPDSEFRRTTAEVNEQYHGMHLLLVCCDAPRPIKGEVAVAALTPGRMVLPGDIVTNPALLPGRLISIFSAGSTGDADRGDTARQAGWHTHIESAVATAAGILIHMPRTATDESACAALGKAAALQFEISGQSHMRSEVVSAIDALGDFIRTRKQWGVGGVIDPADYLRTTRLIVFGKDEAPKELPEEEMGMKMLWDFYRTSAGEHRLRQLVDPGWSRSITTVFLKNANFVDTARLMADIRDYERERLAPAGIHVDFAGDVALSQSLIRGIVETQLQSLVWSLAGIFLATAILGGSWRWGTFCLLPSFLAVLIKLAVMGWLGIPLGVATSMFAAMTLGIGVNCSIQLLEGFRQAQDEGTSAYLALSRALAATGPPALINTIAVSLGFGVLMLSQVPANARLGLLMVLGLANCFVASILVLPPLLHWWPLKSGEGFAQKQRILHGRQKAND